MGKRRSGRELAFRLLFQWDVGGQPLDEVMDIAREESDATDEVWDFATELARGTVASKAELDQIIVRYASGWSLERMATATCFASRFTKFSIAKTFRKA